MEKNNYSFKSTIYLIRHAESLKNIMDVHGGGGMALTETGRKQADYIARRLASYGINKTNSIIFFPNSIQTKETADIIREQLDIPFFEIKNFKTLNMGVANGLSNQELRQRFPDVYKILDDWRCKRIDISKLNVDQMESPQHFYSRGLELLNNLQNNKNNIFIITTSLYILLSHILLENSIDGGGYIHLNVGNGEQTCFVKDDNKYWLDCDKTDVEDILNIARKKKLIL